MTNPPPFVRLPLAFDAAALLADVADLQSDAWVTHFNAGYHNGGWTGVALRSADGNSARLFVEPGATDDPKDTVLLKGRTALADALASFDCRLRSARLLRLAPGGTIDLHHDADLRFDTGQARMHVVLATNDDVEFYVDGERVIMAPGECWYLDLSRPHRVANRGATDRLHLVVDAIVNDWLTAQIAAGDVPRRTAAKAGGASEFERFRQIVFAQPALAARLRETTKSDTFVALTVELGKDAGCDFAATDVNAAMAQGRHRWIAQWIA
jgi:hypothetical protein